MDASASPGELIGIAWRDRPRAPMVTCESAVVVAGGGIEGDHKGLKFPRRGLTLLSVEDWLSALAELADLAGEVPLPWTARRANLLVQGVKLPRAAGAVIDVGEVRLEVTAQTYPCRRMEGVHQGLMKALAPAWRGGVTARVVNGGPIRFGDRVEIVSSPKPHRPRLPG